MSGVTSLGFPYPTGPDPACGGPTPPVNNAIRQLANSVQAWLTANIDTPLDMAQLYAGTQRVRISRTSFTLNNLGSGLIFDTVEMNVGTDTDLGIAPNSLRLGSGIWLVMAEAIAAPSSDTTHGAVNINNATGTFVVDTSLGETAGGGGQVASLARQSAIVTFPLTLTSAYTTGPTSWQYAALSAYRVSDVF